MDNHLTQLFKQKPKNLLSIYCTAGFPQLNDTKTVIQNLKTSGVDFLEIGMPFSDPLADGPVIQQSSTIAIQNGMTIQTLFNQLDELKDKIHIPFVLMGYLNPILQFGETRFLEKCTEAGVSGLIVPDMPLDYFREKWQEKCNALNISNIFLVTPQTSDERIREIDKLSSGFIYAVSTNSLTGQNKNIFDQKPYFEKLKALNLNNPVIIGFGIHNKETLSFAFEQANGAIVGSAFVHMLMQEGLSGESISSFIKKLL